MNRVREQVRTRLTEIAPWRDDISTSVVIVQGVIAVALGMYFLFATVRAVGALAQIVGAYIAVIGIFHLALAVWNPADRAARPSAMLRRAIGLIAGSIAFFSPWIDWVSTQDARLIVSGALILAGVITIGGAFTDRILSETRWASSLSGVVEIAIGAAFFVVTDSDRPLMNVLGIVLIAAGAVLIVRGLLIGKPMEQGGNDV